MTNDEALARLKEMAELKDGWDSYGGKPINPISIEIARVIIGRLGDGWTPVPCASGDVQVEGLYKGKYVEIVVKAEKP